MKRLNTLVIVLLLLLSSTAFAAERLIVVYLMGEGKVTLLVRVPVHPENRKLVLTWSIEDGPAGATAVQLDGEDQNRETYNFPFPYQPGMHYTFVVTLVDSKGKTKSRTVEIGE